jgi:glycosyltransferase involved in cell wall biosynthesis
MKILLVNNLYPPHGRGGAEAAVHNEAVALLELGHEVAVLTTAPFGGWRSFKLSESKEEGVVVFRFYPLNLFWYRNDGKHNAFVRALWYVPNLFGFHPKIVFKKAVKNFKPDAVHLHNINGIFYRLPKLCDKLKLKTVFTLHAVHYAVPTGVIVRGQDPSNFFKPFAALLRRALRSKAIITAPSEWLLDFYSGRGFFKGQKIAVVPNPLSFVGSELTTYKPQAISRFLYVGQLEQYKGINVLLSAMKQLPEDASWQLDIVGDGSMVPELRKQRDQRVVVRGKLSGDEVAAAMRSADILVMPSMCEENAPMVIAEAQAHGLPVIATAVGGVPEMVDEGKTGALVRAGSADDLALAMRRVIQHPEVFSAMRPACLKAAEKYAPKAVAEEYLKLFQK